MEFSDDLGVISKFLVLIHPATLHFVERLSHKSKYLLRVMNKKMQLKDEINNRDLHAPVKRLSFFRFYAELNDHLPEERKKKKFAQSFKGKPSIKNLIESMGVPHSEIELILIDGISVDFDYQMEGGENVSVYPVFELLDVSPLIRLRAEPLRVLRFIIDVNLGKLATKLRLLGFDTLFRNDFEDSEIIEIALREKRIILTRDRAMLTNNKVTHAYWIRNEDPKKQIAEVVNRLQLNGSFKPFSRCSLCNSALLEVPKDSVKSVLQENTQNYYSRFWKCSGCTQIYWKGSHYKHIQNLVDNLKKT